MKFHYLRIRKRKNLSIAETPAETVSIRFSVNQQGVQNIDIPDSLEIKDKYLGLKSFSGRLKYFLKLKRLLTKKDKSLLIYRNYTQASTEQQQAETYSITDQAKHYLILNDVDKDWLLTLVRSKLIELVENEYNNTAVFKHRSTWMGIALILFVLALGTGSLIAFVLGIGVMSTAATFSLLDVSLWLSDNYDKKWEFNHLPALFADWVKHNRAQTVIAATGIILSLAGLTFGIIFFPVIAPFLTLTWWSYFLSLAAVFLMALGPATIADIVNRSLDHRALAVVDIPDDDWNRKLPERVGTQQQVEKTEVYSPLLASSIPKPNKSDEVLIVDEEEKVEVDEGELSYKIIVNKM